MSDYTPEELAKEIWLPVPGWEGYYSVSDLGRVRRDKNGHHTRPGLILCQNGKRYCKVILWRKGRGTGVNVHRLVAAAFIGLCPLGYVVNHKDANKKNNRLDNLEYITSSGNMQHALSHGLHPTGENHPASKLTLEAVREIRGLMARRVTLYQIAKMFGVSRRTLRRIWKGESWRHYL